MRRSYLVAATIAASIITSASFVAPASAACTNSKWKKVSGNAFATIIRGRDCNGNMSVKFSGPAGNTGWLAMSRLGLNNLATTFVDAHITTKVGMKTNGTKMNVFYKHIENSGTKSQTQGTYVLLSYN